MIYTVTVGQPDDLNEFRCHARKLLSACVPPENVAWTSEPAGTLFANSVPEGDRAVVVPRAYSNLADAVICHRDDSRFALLYQALWRIDQGERSLMHNQADPLVHRLDRMAKSIRHDQHRMTAFVRFREIPGSDGDHYIAWYEPQHRVLRRTASFFIDRFSSIRFSILTPDLSLLWDKQTERFAPGLRQQDAASEDSVEDWWRRYYGAIFNPARINSQLMQSHMPKRFWRNLPEANIISGLLAAAGERTDKMIRSSGMPKQVQTDPV